MPDEPKPHCHSQRKERVEVEGSVLWLLPCLGKRELELMHGLLSINFLPLK